MTPRRPSRLNWVGAMLPDGRPARHLETYGLESRNYSAAETAELTAEQIAIARQHPDLFTLVDQPAPKKKAAATQPQTRTATETAEPAPEPDTAAEPATEGGEA